MQTWILKLVVIVVLVLVALRFIPAIPVTSTVTQKQDFFTVSGEGKVTVVPDTAIIEVGITSNQPSVKDAQNQANKVIADITTSLKDLGIAEGDIKTSNYSVYPQYDYRDGGQPNKIIGYQVNANLSIKVRDLSKANQAIDTATSKGANTIGGINLTVDEKKQKELLQEARKLAVDEAKTKADGLAKAAGISLGRIVNVQEAGTPVPPIMFGRNEKAVGMGGAADATTQIQPGSTDITSTVTLYYETR